LLINLFALRISTIMLMLVAGAVSFCIFRLEGGDAV
jgi:hypothetical protein